MTRIRKNWSSSRGEYVGSQFSNGAIANDFHMERTQVKSQPSITLQPVAESALVMLAAVSLESAEQDFGIRNLKQENVSAQVMAAMKAKSHVRDPDMQRVKQERASAKFWEQSFSQGRSSKSDRCNQKPSAPLCNSDYRPASALPKKISARRDTVDEEQLFKSSVADNEVIDSDFSARMSDLSVRVERAQRGLGGVETMQGLISGSVQAHLSEREPSIEEASRGLQESVCGHSTRRKRRQKPCEAELQTLPWTAIDGCRTDPKTQKPVMRGDSASNSYKSSMKIIFKAPQDRDICERHKIRAELANVGGDIADVKQDKQVLTSEKVYIDDGERNQPKARLEEVVEDFDEMNKLNATVEIVANAVHDWTKQREKSPETRTDVGDWTRQVRARTEKVESDAPQTSTAETGEDIFPKKWKYKGLVEIAEKYMGTNGRLENLCSRTDGYHWRCPLRAVEGSSVCQHHLNKARQKMGKGSSVCQHHLNKARQKMGKNKTRKVKSETKESDEALISSYADHVSALSFDPSSSSEHCVPTKFPRARRYKTAKLSVL